MLPILVAARFVLLTSDFLEATLVVARDSNTNPHLSNPTEKDTMKPWTLVFVPILLLINVHCAQAQITVTSVSASGNASVGGGGFPSDSDGFSVNNFTGSNGITASASSGMLLNSASSSATAETTQFGDATFGGFAISTSVSAGGFEAFSPSAGVQTQIVFQLDTVYDVEYFSSLSVDGPSASLGTFFTQIEPNGNIVLGGDSLDGFDLFGSDFVESSFTGRIGPGIFSIGDNGDAAGSFSSQGFSFQSITLTPVTVPEPSALFFLSTMGIAALVRRNR